MLPSKEFSPPTGVISPPGDDIIYLENHQAIC